MGERSERDERSSTLFRCDGMSVGTFRRAPTDPDFHNTGPVGAFLLVYPRTSVIIEHAGKEAVIADPTRVMLYNRGQEYTRRALVPRGDVSEWFAFPSELVADAFRPSDPRVDDRIDRPFVATHAAASAASYLLQRRVVLHVAQAAQRDALFVEEAMMRLLADATRSSHAAPLRKSPRRTTTSHDHRALAEACRAYLGKRIAERPSLSDVARAVGASPFHLARVFRANTGSTLTKYMHDLRIRTALERVTDGEDLARVAVDLGYATHSHFTAFFRRKFGATPTSIRHAIEQDRDSARTRM